jgi:hypothetical protein
VKWLPIEETGDMRLSECELGIEEEEHERLISE